MRVLVTHPGMQYAHQLALALYEYDHLAGLWSGIPVTDGTKTRRDWANFSSRVRQSPIPAELRRHFPAFPVLRRLVSYVGGPKLRNSLAHGLDHLFDRWVARRVSAVRPDVIVCYENSALHTFRAAKAIGSLCVLDAASVHYRAGAEWSASSQVKDAEWIERQKQVEIELADAILTCSPLAAGTYVAGGVAESKLYTCPLGTDLPANPQVNRFSSEVRRFVFVGSLMRRKGVDLLLDIFERFHHDGTSATLTFIGGISEQDLMKRIRSIPSVTHRPFMQQQLLFEEVAKHDCLILPSRFDSFGMVVAEAMAVGVPALVTDRVGAKCIIEDHPGAGWVVPCEIEALHHKIRQLIDCPSMVAMASEAAKAAAQHYTWDSYRKRVRAILQEVYRRSCERKQFSAVSVKLAPKTPAQNASPVD